MSLSIFSILTEIAKCQKAGEQLTNSATWANKASLAAVLIVFLNSGVAILNANGVTIGITPEQLSTTAQLFSALIVFILDRIHVASNPNAGKTTIKE